MSQQPYERCVPLDRFLLERTSVVQIHRLAVEVDEQTSRIVSNDDWQVHCLLEHLDFVLLYG